MKQFLLALLCFAFSFIFPSSLLAQTVAVALPNGVEVLVACQQYTVTWTQTGSPSNYWNIDYSLDGGTIWTSVASNYLSTNGQFLWTVPNVQSNIVIMRVYDSQNISVTDQSNNVFTINIPIVLTSPNGGEVWQGQTVHTITWNMIGTSNLFNLYYSTDDGSSWIAIVYSYSTATGSSFIPAQSATYLVTGIDGNNYSGQANIIITVLPLPALAIDLSAMDQQCIQTVSVPLQYVTPPGGIFSGLAVSGTNFSPSTARLGIHAITYIYTDGNGCAASAVDFITVVNCISVEENEDLISRIYPNPNNGLFTFEINKNWLGDDKGNLDVLDVMGNVVAQIIIVSGSNDIDLTALS
jgi:hypothetical protein